MLSYVYPAILFHVPVIPLFSDGFVTVFLFSWVRTIFLIFVNFMF